MSGWIGVDLDGTLATYNGWGDGKIGAPIPAMAERVRAWLADDRDVRIVTARVAETGLRNQVGGVDDTTFATAQREAIQAWTEEHFGVRLQVTATKDFGMVELWDDRAIQVEANTGRRIEDAAPRPSLAAPVAWRWRRKGKESWSVTTDAWSETECKNAGMEQEPLYTAALSPRATPMEMNCREALQLLVSQLELVHADTRYQGVWQIAQLHIGPYTGRTYTAELEAAKKALGHE